MDDLISRQAAIEALKNDMASLDHIIKGMSANDVRLDAYVSQRNQVNYDIYTINNLPPVQPAQLGTNLASLGTDCISRQQAIDYFVTNVGFHDEDGYPIEDTDELRKIWTEYFSGIPSAEPKRGKWHYSDGKPATIGLSFGVICDQCGTESEYCTNFCGECGADMRGEHE